MIKCGADPAVPKDSPCVYCCIHCNQKDDCDYTCPIVKRSNTEQDILESSCEKKIRMRRKKR